MEILWNCWLKYKKGKRKTIDYLQFEENLERNLLGLAEQLQSGAYRHGTYRSFEVKENKKRLISVASVRDRLVHRLLYEYLVPIIDHKLDFDVWSCRGGKGLVAAVFRCGQLVQKYGRGYFWRADISRFFASVDKDILMSLIKAMIPDALAVKLLREVVASYPVGLSIGNLTSQILANLYLNEFDRFVRHELKPLAYMRYGDDFILFDAELASLKMKETMAIEFLHGQLGLRINPNNNFIAPVWKGIKYLGCNIGPEGIILNRRNRRRVFRRLNQSNLASYHGLIQKFGNKDLRDKFDWSVFENT